VSDLIATLRWLVDIPSVTGSEDRIATGVAERLLPVWDVKGVQRIGNSLVVGERTGRPLISLYGHLDTVPEQEENRGSHEEGGRLYGLGTSDMKAGLAVMVHLLEDASIRNGAYDVIAVFYDSEEGPFNENGLIDVLEQESWLKESEFAIVLEPTALRLELGCNGSMNGDVVFRGEAAHSARPWLGDNAITKAGGWLSALHEREPRVEILEDLEFREVVTVTRANGGIANNVVPAEFRLNINYRFPPSLTVDDAKVRLRSIAADADDLRIHDAAPAGLIPEANEHLVRLEHLLGGERFPKQGWTDVARLTELGIPAVNYGPGDPALAHRVGEWVRLADVEVAYEVLRCFLGS